MSCQGCVSNLTSALEAVEGVSSVEVEVGSAVIHHQGVISEALDGAITGAGFTVGLPEFNWSDGAVWKQSAHNTKWCLIGCSICLLYTSPSPRDRSLSRMPSSA